MKFRSMSDAPATFRAETTFNSRSGIFKVLLEIPVFKYIFSEILIRQGKIFIRPNKVDPTKPDYYWLEGFKVRNMSQRQDGTYWTNGSVHQFKTSN
ncbi:unannotated protein [freshwater metagenome]|jgi:hypothetical protein|uniref:Unannotated protein n=1 Tax=freshwater metagenome TaxID=449393 RepID=A0A6J6C170_9ZZZZ|nr:hypothetical protein [Actinomycetota bacterium]MSX60531.1 hypothetical protein [Actinomycetota bacterium]MTA94834.1 hypothetical protein [Actinomycetota bacterium]MTB30913.1 hypothetical protein [Actinomycetota bacterium]